MAALARSTMTEFRWLMTVPAGVAVWFLVLFTGIFATAILDVFCPPELIVSGSCTASWYQPALEAVVAIFTGISALGVVLAPALVAPSKRRMVAWVAFFIGLASATAMFIPDPSLTVWPYAAAVFGGLVGLYIAGRIWPKDGTAVERFTA
jgi:hypothetical protein